MDRGLVLLQGLKARLQTWLHTIKKATGAANVLMLDGQNGTFTITVEWDALGKKESYSRVFSREYVFGDTHRGNQLAWRVQKRACDYARDIMQEVLRLRGVI